MQIGVLRRYAPFLLALVVTGVIVIILLLRPEQALGLFVNVVQPLNDRNSQPGFTLGEEIVFTGDLNFKGDEGAVHTVTLDIVYRTGDGSFADVIGLDLPLGETTDEDFSGQMHERSGKVEGKLLVTVIFDAVKIFDVSGANGYGYGYDPGSTDKDGNILYILRYTPPEIPGDYEAKIAVVAEDEGGDVITPPVAVTSFSVLGEFSATALAVLYPASAGEALAGDLVVMQLDATSTKSRDFIATVNGIPQTTVSGELLSGAKSMVHASKVHRALRMKWEVDDDADLLLPFRVPGDTLPGARGPMVATVVDIAGQEATASSAVNVVDTRSTFNVYLLPRFNFITPALQCPDPSVAGDCTDSYEFRIPPLLNQTVPNVNQEFADVLAKNAADVTAKEVISAIWDYDATVPDFRLHFTTSAVNSLDTMGVGRGYIVLARDPIELGADPFIRTADAENDQFPGTEIPVPIKLTFEGSFIGNAQALPPTTDVEPIWNLVGPHGEVDTTVGVWLAPLAVRERQWDSLIAFRNELSIALDDSGDVSMLADGKPEIVFIRRFESLRPPEGFIGAGPNPLPSGSMVPAGSGLWLLMCDPVTQGGCDGGGTLPPVGPAP